LWLLSDFEESDFELSDFPAPDFDFSSLDFSSLLPDLSPESPLRDESLEDFLG